MNTLTPDFPQNEKNHIGMKTVSNNISYVGNDSQSVGNSLYFQLNNLVTTPILCWKKLENQKFKDGNGRKRL